MHSAALAFQMMEVFGQREMSHLPIPDRLLLVAVLDDRGSKKQSREGHKAWGQQPG